MIDFILAAVWAAVGLVVLWWNSRDDLPMQNRISSLRFNYVISLCTLIAMFIAEGIKHL